MNLLKQINIPLIGSVKEILSSSLIYVSAINFILISITSYSTTLKPFFDSIGWTWFNLPVFLITLTMFVVLMMLIEYKFIMPSIYEFKNKQEYNHNNLIRKDIEDLRDELRNYMSSK